MNFCSRKLEHLRSWIGHGTARYGGRPTCAHARGQCRHWKAARRSSSLHAALSAESMPRVLSCLYWIFSASLSHPCVQNMNTHTRPHCIQTVKIVQCSLYFGLAHKCRFTNFTVSFISKARKFAWAQLAQKKERAQKNKLAQKTEHAQKNELAHINSPLIFYDRKNMC